MAARVSGHHRKGAPLAPPRTTGAPGAGCLCQGQGQRGGSARGGRAQALGLFLMSSTSASTISLTSSWERRERVGSEDGVSVTVSWRYLHPRGGRHPAPIALHSGHLGAQLPARWSRSRGAAELAQRRGAPGPHCAKDTYVKSDPGLPVQLLFRFGAVSLQKVLRGGGREKQAWSGVAVQLRGNPPGCPHSRLQLPSCGPRRARCRGSRSHKSCEGRL